MTTTEYKAWRRELVKRSWFPAQYAGACARCGETFGSGTLIHPDGLSTWLAECCAPPMPEGGK